MHLEPLSHYFTRGELSEIEVLSLIPRTFAKRYDKLSTQGILALIEHFGGSYVYVPAKPHSESKLAKVLSGEDLIALCKLHGGSNLFGIPSGSRLRTHLRNKNIVAMREQGMSEREVAQRIGVSDRWIRQIMQLHRLARK